jgi:hypothetical protein
MGGAFWMSQTRSASEHQIARMAAGVPLRQALRAEQGQVGCRKLGVMGDERSYQPREVTRILQRISGPGH